MSTLSSLQAADTGNNDAELVARLRNGAKSAFNEVYDRYRPRLFSFLLRLSGRRDLTADLLQETWIRFARAASNLAEDTKLASYLFTIAINVYRSHQRWAILDVSRVLLFGLATREDKFEYDELSLDNQSQVANLERALSQLSASDRELLVLIGIHGFEPQETANMLNLGQEVVRTRLSRARKRLQEQMTKLEPAGTLAKGQL